MTVKEIFDNRNLYNDNTDIRIRQWDGKNHVLLAHGKYYNDDVLKYFKHEVVSFMWQYNNIYIVLPDAE